MTIQLYGLSGEHKSALAKISERLLTPQEFLNFYPGTTYKELAQICRCSEPTVKRWFHNGKTRCEPKESHRLWLTLAHTTVQRIEHQRRSA